MTRPGFGNARVPGTKNVWCPYVEDLLKVRKGDQRMKGTCCLFPFFGFPCNQVKAAFNPWIFHKGNFSMKNLSRMGLAAIGYGFNRQDSPLSQALYSRFKNFHALSSNHDLGRGVKPKRCHTICIRERRGYASAYITGM
jgi:hypothetical protein